MRVLLAQSYLGRKGVSDQLVFPIGLSCIATALAAAGHEPWIVDLNVGDDPYLQLEREIHRHQPDVIGVSQRNIDSTTKKAPFVYHTQLRRFLDVARRAAPGVPVVVGGPGFTQSSRTFMERYPFDFGIQSEGEESFVDLLAKLGDPSKVRGLYWRDQAGTVHYNGDRDMPDFSALPYPRRDFVDWGVYRAEEKRRRLFLDIGIESTRGCPRKCAYCNYPFLNGVKLRRKPPERIVDEIQYLQNTFDVQQFTFTDSRFNENAKHAAAICEEILRRGVRIRWIAWLGFRRVSAEFLGLLRDAGCFRVAFSPDGLLQPSLDRMRKEIDTAEVLHTIEAVRKVKGLKSSWSFFATPPGTSHKEQLAYLAAWIYIHGTLPGRGRMMVNWCRVEEGTHFAEIAREDGVVPDDIEMLPESPDDLHRLFYVSPGFEGWSRFWDRFLDLELEARAGAGRLTRALRPFGFPDLTPPHLREV